MTNLTDQQLVDWENDKHEELYCPQCVRMVTYEDWMRCPPSKCIPKENMQEEG